MCTAACPAARIWSSSSTAAISRYEPRRRRTVLSRRTSATTICTRASFFAFSRVSIFAQKAPTAAFPRFHSFCGVSRARESNLLYTVSQRLQQGSQRTGFRPHGRSSLPSRAQKDNASTTLPRICCHRREIGPCTQNAIFRQRFFAREHLAGASGLDGHAAASGHSNRSHAPRVHCGMCPEPQAAAHGCFSACGTRTGDAPA
jgi:hypothetical protein